MIETFRVENIFNIRRSHCEKNFPDKIVFETTRKSCEILDFISDFLSYKKIAPRSTTHYIHKLSLKIKISFYSICIYTYTNNRINQDKFLFN